MEVFLGSKVINAAEGIKSKKAKADLGKALVQAIQKLESSGNKLSYMKGSPSFVDIKKSQATEAVLDPFRKKKKQKKLCKRREQRKVNLPLRLLYN